MNIYCKNGEILEVHLTRTELESAFAAQTISGVDVMITGETKDGRYRTVAVSDILVTRTLNALHDPIGRGMEDPFPTLFVALPEVE